MKTNSVSIFVAGAGLLACMIGQCTALLIPSRPTSQADLRGKPSIDIADRIWVSGVHHHSWTDKVINGNDATIPSSHPLEAEATASKPLSGIGVVDQITCSVISGSASSYPLAKERFCSHLYGAASTELEGAQYLLSPSNGCLNDDEACLLRLGITFQAPGAMTQNNIEPMCSHAFDAMWSVCGDAGGTGTVIMHFEDGSTATGQFGATFDNGSDATCPAYSDDTFSCVVGSA